MQTRHLFYFLSRSIGIFYAKYFSKMSDKPSGRCGKEDKDSVYEGEASRDSAFVEGPDTSSQHVTEDDSDRHNDLEENTVGANTLSKKEEERYFEELRCTIEADLDPNATNLDILIEACRYIDYTELQRNASQPTTTDRAGDPLDEGNWDDVGTNYSEENSQRQEISKAKKIRLTTEEKRIRRNEQEKQNRSKLTEKLHELRDAIPDLKGKKKTAKVILMGAIDHINCLKEHLAKQKEHIAKENELLASNLASAGVVPYIIGDTDSGATCNSGNGPAATEQQQQNESSNNR